MPKSEFERDFEAVDRAFAELPVELALQAYGPACFAVAEVIRDRAKATTAFTDRTGMLRKSISAFRASTVIRVGDYSRRFPDASAAVWMGDDDAYGTKDSGPWYAPFQEFGTVHMGLTPSGAVLGAAIDQTRAAGLAAFAQEFRRLLPAAARKAGLKAGTSP